MPAARARADYFIINSNFTALHSEQLFYSQYSFNPGLDIHRTSTRFKSDKTNSGLQTGITIRRLKGTILKLSRARINPGVGENG
jgi:hypothetical protein